MSYIDRRVKKPVLGSVILNLESRFLIGDQRIYKAAHQSRDDSFHLFLAAGNPDFFSDFFKILQMDANHSLV